MANNTSAQVLQIIESTIASAGYRLHDDPTTMVGAPETVRDNLFRVLPLPGGEMRAMGAARDTTRDFEVEVGFRVSNQTPTTQLRQSLAAEDEILNRLLALECIDSMQQTPRYSVSEERLYLLMTFTVSATYCRT